MLQRGWTGNGALDGTGRALDGSASSFDIRWQDWLTGLLPAGQAVPDEKGAQLSIAAQPFVPILSKAARNRDGMMCDGWFRGDTSEADRLLDHKHSFLALPIDVQVSHFCRGLVTLLLTSH